MSLFPDDFPFGRNRSPEPTPAANPTQREAVPTAWEQPVDSPIESAVQTAPVAAALPPAIEPVIMPQPSPVSGQTAPATERRKALRQTLVARAQLRADVGFTGVVNVDVQNISLLGVRFVSPHPIDPQLKAQLRMEAGPLRWSTRLRVVTCQSDSAGHFHIGCQFVGNELMKPWTTTSAAAA